MLVHYDYISDPNDTISNYWSQFDFAVIHLSRPFDIGNMGLAANFAGGPVEISGYPGSSSGQLVTQAQTVTVQAGYNLFNAAPLGLGSSGGPVWITQNGQPTVVGVVSSQSKNGALGYDVQFTSADLALIDSWVAADDATESASSAFLLYSYGEAASPIAVLDSSVNIAYSWYNLEAMAQAGALKSIAFSDPLPTVVSLTTADFNSFKDALALLTGGASVEVTEVAPADAAATAAEPYVSSIAVQGLGAQIVNNLDSLQQIDAQGKLASLQTTDVVTPVLTLSIYQIVEDSAVLDKIQNANLIQYQVSDTAAHVSADLDGLQGLKSVGKIAGISLTDRGYGILSATPAQVSSDSNVIDAIAGNFTLDQTAAAPNLTLTGLAGHANTALFVGPVGDYAIITLGDGLGLTVTDTGTGRSSIDQVSNFNALQFSDATVIIAPTPGPATAPTGGNVAALYAAVLGRIPDVAGLAYYEAVLVATPTLSLGTLAEDFLQSPEYSGNSAHNYAQTAAGEAQFITDSYNNLLHRAPETGAIPYYQALIGQFTEGLTPGSLAYQAADLQAHATLLVDFSTAPEFLSDVQVTAQTPASAGFAGHWLVLV